ncbi:MAG: flagellar type III secretion system protein FliQ [Firmicutes bacterium]|nr:flagellar type III secretion system protein FliQ [Bacillota bacterium]MBV1727738.1 flagellar type III secretion system protein FliQ [Desulforudis sp.]MBU4532800.1 flagellar type III secretion system protein FliQ [Bacillota bacterium]MBU4554128.1 flagellar type III secretion system protein FliQ [Bacillota bacterium]MBV1736207.1 flagellar type III secretion system protein FliQ [Desulforudis sp.]
MTTVMALELVQKSLMMVLLLIAPPLLVSLLVGLVISLLQAATQVQDQMITFVPRMIAVFLSLLLLAPWYMKMITSFAHDVITTMAKTVG